MKRGPSRAKLGATRAAPWHRLLLSLSSAEAWLPYNWNWQRRWSEADDFLTSNPIVLLDVGARGEAPSELASLLCHVHRVGFEPDPEECHRLNEEEAGTYFPSIVAGTQGTSALRVFRSREYSSLLPLSSRYKRLWLGEMPEDARVHFETVTLDNFLANNPDLQPDLLKLDTQGTELDILHGSRQILARIGLVEVEVEFVEMYEGQALFNDITAFLYDHGFELLYLNRSFRTRREVYKGPSRGQLVDGDALFGKREDRVGDLTAEQLVKYIILLCQYGHMDIGWQLFSENAVAGELVPRLEKVFRGAPHPLRRALIMQWDKLIAAALHLRRYNQRGMDNDRAWPIR